MSDAQINCILQVVTGCCICYLEPITIIPAPTALSFRAGALLRGEDRISLVGYAERSDALIVAGFGFPRVGLQTVWRDEDHYPPVEILLSREVLFSPSPVASPADTMVIFEPLVCRAVQNIEQRLQLDY